MVNDKSLQEDNLEDVNYLSIRSELLFGESTNKSYALLGFIISSEGELVSLDVAVNYEHTVVDNEYEDVDLEEGEEIFISLLRQREGNYRSQIIKEELIRNIKEDDFFSILESAQEESNDVESISRVIKREVGLIVSEKVELNLYLQWFQEEELQNKRKDLFDEEEGDKNEEESSKKKKKRLKLVKEEDREVEERDDEELTLKCSPVVSPVKGVAIARLKKGDEIKVTIADRSEKGEELSKLLTGREGSTTGRIKEVDFKGDIGRYKLLVEIREGIYGELTLSGDLKVEIIGAADSIIVKESKKNKAPLLLIILSISIFLLVLLYYLTF